LSAPQPREPLGNPLLLLPNLVQRRHLLFPSWQDCSGNQPIMLTIPKLGLF
jgi:hypothetical protein